jgi:hypothetical protein
MELIFSFLCCLVLTFGASNVSHKNYMESKKDKMHAPSQEKKEEGCNGCGEPTIKQTIFMEMKPSQTSLLLCISGSSVYNLKQEPEVRLAVNLP